jgi:IS30 family transposase
MTYHHLSLDERNQIQQQLNQGHGVRAIAQTLNRHQSTISREIRRGINRTQTQTYCASQTHHTSQQQRHRGHGKLSLDHPNWPTIRDYLDQGWSPQQITGRLKHMHPDQPTWVVSHQTIYTFIHALPRGELKKELLSYLRKKGKPSKASTDARGKIANMRLIHDRPEEIGGRSIGGHWEGDLIKGAGNKSAVGTLVERKSRFVVLVKLPDATAASVLQGFSEAFERIPAVIRESMTYDQGKEMACHEELSERIKMDIYFCDPHSPWQRGSNENANGLIREYLPKGIDLSTFDQDYLDKIARALNGRPRKVLGFLTPEEVFSQEVIRLKVAVALQS